MKNYFQNRNAMRIIRVAVGLFLIGAAIYERDWMLAFMGGFIVILLLFNMGCCGASGCSTNFQEPKNKPDDVG